MPIDGPVHSWLLISGMGTQRQGIPLQQAMKPKHRDHPAVPNQLHTGVLELAQSPHPDGRRSPNRAGILGKSSRRGSTWGSTACKQAGPTVSSATNPSITKMHRLKNLFMDEDGQEEKRRHF